MLDWIQPAGTPAKRETMPPRKNVPGKTPVKTPAKKRPPAVRMTLGDQLRAAIRESGLTPYRVAKDGGFDPGILTRFLNQDGGGRGNDLRLSTADTIARVLGLEFTKTAPGTEVRHDEV